MKEKNKTVFLRYIVNLDADISDKIKSRILKSWSIFITLSVKLVKPSFHLMVDNNNPRE